MIKAHVYEIEFPLFGGFSISLSLSLSHSLLAVVAHVRLFIQVWVLGEKEEMMYPPEAS